VQGGAGGGGKAVHQGRGGGANASKEGRSLMPSSRSASAMRPRTPASDRAGSSPGRSTATRPHAAFPPLAGEYLRLSLSTSVPACRYISFLFVRFIYI
jgi:hypothetical protein